MNTCLVCGTAFLRGLPMSDKETLALAAQEFIQGMISGLHDSKADLKNLLVPPRGTCIVERCARLVEEPCNSCREATCTRCTIAAELRGAQERINAARDAELGDGDLEAAVDKIIGGLCEEHAAFGAVLAQQWYSRRAFAVPLVAASP